MRDKKVHGCKNHYTEEQLKTVFFENGAEANKCTGCDNFIYEDGIVMCDKLNNLTK